MSVIKALYIQNYRNIKNQLIEPSSKINLILGKNGQGKTNLLEAIYFIAHNKSFKTRYLNKIIPFNSNTISLALKLENDRIKLQKTQTKNQTLLNGSPVKNTSKITQLLPIQLISADRGFITYSEPKIKRQYLDWGVFHVEQEFIKLHKTHKQIINQINHSLAKQINIKGLDAWFFNLAKITIKINKLRKNYIDELKQELKTNKQNSKTLKQFSFSLDTGLPKETNNMNEEEFFNYLLKQKNNILKKGFLSFGCHRANIIFKYKNKSIDVFSRGEQKVFSIIFLLLQVYHLKQKGIKAIVLIDDLSSELDKQKVKILISFLIKLDLQIFITNITNDEALSTKDMVFNIKAGVVSRETKESLID